jgi:hypothetical protein
MTPVKDRRTGRTGFAFAWVPNTVQIAQLDKPASDLACHGHAPYPSLLLILIAERTLRQGLALAEDFSGCTTKSAVHIAKLGHLHRINLAGDRTNNPDCRAKH